MPHTRPGLPSAGCACADPRARALRRPAVCFPDRSHSTAGIHAQHTLSRLHAITELKQRAQTQVCQFLSHGLFDHKTAWIFFAQIVAYCFFALIQTLKILRITGLFLLP